MTDFIFIRHGETDWNRQLRFQGQIDVPLNDTGHRQAAALARRLAAEPFDEFLSSDLQRAQQTAAPLAGVKQRPPLLAPALREQAFGVLEGLNQAEIETQHPALWQQWLRHEADHALPGGGESTLQFHARVLASVRTLAEEHPQRTLLVVTHGGVLDMLWRTVHGAPLSGPRTCEIPNTGINRLRWRGGTLELLQWADAAHLGAA